MDLLLSELDRFQTQMTYLQQGKMRRDVLNDTSRLERLARARQCRAIATNRTDNRTALGTTDTPILLPDHLSHH